MDDKKLNDMIKESSENIEMPESLRPENVEKKLEATKQKEKKRNWKKAAARTLEAAAVLAVVFFAGQQVGQRSVLTAPEKKTLLSQENEETQAVGDKQENGETQAAGDEQKSMEKQAAGDTQESMGAQGTGDKQEGMKAQDAGEVQNDAGDQAGNAAPDAGKDTAKSTEAPEKIEGMQTFADVGELYEKLKEYAFSEENQMALMARGNDMVYEEMAVDMAADLSAGAKTADSGAGYSQTNLREASVDEGDIIKTDGDHIYMMKGGSSVVIVDADGTEMEKIAVVEPRELNESVKDLYVDGDRMILVTQGTTSELSETQPDVYETKNFEYVKILTYDISDRSNAKLLGEVQQEGAYQSSRKNGRFVYAFTRYQPEIGDSEEESDIMPLVGKDRLSTAEIYAPEKLQSTAYLVVGAVDTENPTGMCSRKAVISGAENFYVSGESIFIINTGWESGSGDTTDILKFSYKNGEIKGVGSCRFTGYLNDTFSLDEYNGYLRLVCTDSWSGSDETNALYVFDEKMKMVGKIDDIAPGETIRSARFMGDRGYFVTFRQTDPLFSVDLSDPENPQITGELKVSGFSSYLHFYGEDRLLGIGYEADEETGVTSGIKLSMFDTSDPGNVKEIRRYVLKDAQYLPLFDNYKAVMIDPQKNLFGFVCDGNYLVFKYDDENGFENLLTYKLDSGKERYRYGWYGGEDVRGIYIGDVFYLMEGNVLRAFDMTEGFEQKEKLEF